MPVQSPMAGLVAAPSPLVSPPTESSFSDVNVTGDPLVPDATNDPFTVKLVPLAALMMVPAATVNRQRHSVSDNGCLVDHVNTRRSRAPGSVRRATLGNFNERHHHDERTIVTAAGAVPVRAPRVNDKRIDEQTGERARFASAILPAWARKSPTVAEVLPLLYLHGLSSGDFGPALEQFLGSGAGLSACRPVGLSASTVTRLTGQWQDEAKAVTGASRPT